jgi:hypothetical protein
MTHPALKRKIMAEIIRLTKPAKRKNWRIICARIATICAIIAMIGLFLLLCGCGPSIATVSRTDGFNAQWKGFQYLKGEPAYAETKEIRIKVVVTEDIGYPGAAATYSHPEGIIRIKGKMIAGKIVLCPAVIGHEIQHALEYQDGRFVNPDRLEEYEK